MPEVPASQLISIFALQIMTMENRGMIESAAVCFFTQVMSCHIMNQLLFAKVLCEVIKEQSSSSKSGKSYPQVGDHLRALSYAYTLNMIIL